MYIDSKTIDHYMGLPYQTVVESDRCGGAPCFMAYNPELEGCMGFGATWKDAIASLKEARREYIETALEMGWEVPQPQYSGLPKHVVPRSVKAFRYAIPKNNSVIEYGTKVPA